VPSPGRTGEPVLCFPTLDKCSESDPRVVLYAGWEVEIADAAKVKGLAPLACKTDRIDAWVLAELSRRDLVPSIWLPDPSVRAERERARFRLHLVRHRSSLKHRIHATLLTHGMPRSTCRRGGWLPLPALWARFSGRG
jgi:transposase